MRKLNKKQKIFIESAVKWYKKGATINQLDNDDIETLERINDYETLHIDANNYYYDLQIKENYAKN